MNPFDQLEDSAVWQSFLEQGGFDAERTNLTDYWRAAGRPHLSPRRFARMYHHLDDVTFTGTSPDCPVLAGYHEAMHYVQLLDYNIMDAVFQTFRRKLKAEPAKMLLEGPDDDMCRTFTALFAGAALADDGDRTSAAQAITADAVRQTEHLDIYAQETAVAKVQRAFIEAKKLRSGRVIDGEFVEDR